MSEDLSRDVKDVESLSAEQLQLEKLRHSAAHVMAQAVRRRWPETRLGVGPTIEDGFYYDMDIPERVTEEDLPALEREMRRIAKKNFAFEQESWPKERALEHWKDDPYKQEIISGIEDSEVSVYKQGEFTDLCSGPHLDRTGQLQHFKLTSVAGAYWRGDEKNAQLTRIYGTAFLTAEELSAHVERIEQAKARDHRKLGRELGLFSFHPEAPAMPFFHPKGAVLYNLLVETMRGYYREEGYDEVVTPQIFDTALWKTSGHYDHFLENMFLVEIDEREFGVKPMNCPSHCLMFSERKWSYRDLPVRFADFGRLHRYERSGATHGLTRVRSMSQDDAHVFCTIEQVRGEIERVIRMIRNVYRDFHLGEPEVHLATRPAKALGDPELWNQAEAALRTVLDESDLAFEVEEGEGAFYGPKIDFFFKDAIGRPWQLSTVQLDFNLPRRFDLSYTTPDDRAEPPVIIHRAILGTIERFLGVLIEHHAGAFPPWLAPEQVRVLPITDDQEAHGRDVVARLRAAGLRASLDDRSEKIGRKIRDAQVTRVPWMLVVGAREAEAGEVAVRHLKAGDAGSVSVDAFIEDAVTSVREKHALREAAPES